MSRTVKPTVNENLDFGNHHIVKGPTAYKAARGYRASCRWFLVEIASRRNVNDFEKLSESNVTIDGRPAMLITFRGTNPHAQNLPVQFVAAIASYDGEYLHAVAWCVEPLFNDSVGMIYSEHFFEHLEREEGERFLRECQRVLIPAGRLNVGVPNARLILRDYADREKWARTRERYHPPSCTTPMHSVNYFFRQGGEHRYAYDEETLIAVMRDCGFKDVHGREWNPELDSERRRDGTLYVDGQK